MHSENGKGPKLCWEAGSDPVGLFCQKEEEKVLTEKAQKICLR